MSKKLIKHGNSLALVISKALLKELRADENTPLEVTIKKGELIVRPVREKNVLSKPERTDLIKHASKKVMNKYKEALRDLAK